MLELISDFDPASKELECRGLLHWTYLHGKLEEALRCDLQSVILSTVETDKIWINYCNGKIDDGKIKAYCPCGIREFLRGGQFHYAGPDFHWEEVRVHGYPGKCYLFLKWWCNWYLWESETWRPNIEMRGIVVDSEEIEEGINYILKDYHGPELRGVEPEKIKGAIKFQEWLKEHCNTAPKT